MSDWWEQLVVARSRLNVMGDELRLVGSGDMPPIGPELARLYADWCDMIADLLRQI